MFLGNFKLMVVGGYGNGGVGSSVEIYDLVQFYKS